MERGKRLSSRALTVALVCGSVVGVTGASGHGDNAVQPHFAHPVGIRMSARVQVTDPTTLGDGTANADARSSSPGDETTTTPTTTGTSTTPTTSSPASSSSAPATTTTATTPTTTDPRSSGTPTGDQSTRTGDTTTSSQGTATTDTTSADTTSTDTTGTATDTTGTDTPGTDTPGTDTPGTDTPGTDTTGTDTTDTPGTTCAPAPGTPGFVPAGHATGDPWKSCTQIGPGGSGQAGGGSGQAGGGTTPPVTVPSTPAPPVTTTPTTTPPATTGTSPSTTGTSPSTTGTAPGGTKTTGQSSNPFSTRGPWTQVAKTSKNGKPSNLFNNANGLLGLESGLGINGTFVGLRSGLASGATGLGLGGADSSSGAGASSSVTASGRPAGKAHVQGGGAHSGGSGFTTFIEHQIIRVIPSSVWLALAGAFGLAIMATGAAIFFGRRSRRQANRIAEVSAAALTDPLTGVLNRRGFTEAVERELARSRRYARPFVIAYVDVRGLKGVNDSEGHLAGDDLLKAAARTLSGSARAHDVIGRLGGDEFGVLLAEQSVEDAQGVVARIREHVQATRAELGFGAFWDLTIGVASFSEDGDSFEELIAAADRRLYEQRGIELSASR